MVVNTADHRRSIVSATWHFAFGHQFDDVAWGAFQADDASSTLVGRSEMHWQVKPNMWRLFIPSFHFDGYSGSSCNKRATRRARSRVQHSLWTGESEDARQLHRGFWSLSASTPLFRSLRSTTMKKTDAQVIDDDLTRRQVVLNQERRRSFRLLASTSRLRRLPRTPPRLSI